MSDLFPDLARSDSWANRRLYGVLLELPRARTTHDLGPRPGATTWGLPFAGVLGTVNPLPVADRIWLHRLTQQGPLPTRLDQPLGNSVAVLWLHRRSISFIS